MLIIIVHIELYTALLYTLSYTLLHIFQLKFGFQKLILNTILVTIVCDDFTNIIEIVFLKHDFNYMSRAYI